MRVAYLKELYNSILDTVDDYGQAQIYFDPFVNMAYVFMIWLFIMRLKRVEVQVK